MGEKAKAEGQVTQVVETKGATVFQEKMKSSVWDILRASEMMASRLRRKVKYLLSMWRWNPHPIPLLLSLANH